MKVVCAWHWPKPIVIGEKCPQCGEMAKNVPLLGFAICWNRDCEVVAFKLDRGEPTHGICEDCALRGRIERPRVKETGRLKSVWPPPPPPSRRAAKP